MPEARRFEGRATDRSPDPAPRARTDRARGDVLSGPREARDATGEAASYMGVRPKRPVDQKGGLGAIELVARYSELRVGDEAFPTFADPAKSARKAKEWAVGLNWYPERRIKIGLNYGLTRFEGGAATGDREDEKTLVTRFQVAF